MTSGYVPWPYNHVFSPFPYSFFGNTANQGHLLITIKNKWKISNFKSLHRTCNFFIEFYSLFYEVIYPTGTLNEANKHKCKRKDKRRLKITIKFFTRKKIQKLAFAPAYEGVRGRAGEDIEKKIKTK